MAQLIYDEKSLVDQQMYKYDKFLHSRINKYTGSGGKYNSSDANAEFVAEIRRILEENNISYQIAELGKVEIGGGGTIAYILANKGVDVIDCGVPVLSMHSPYEVTSKFDIYGAYKTYTVFLK